MPGRYPEPQNTATSTQSGGSWFAAPFTYIKGVDLPTFEPGSVMAALVALLVLGMACGEQGVLHGDDDRLPLQSGRF